MRKYGIIVAVLLLLVAAAMAQNVIKYSLTSSSALAIGRAVKLGATDNTCVLAGAADGDDVGPDVGHGPSPDCRSLSDGRSAAAQQQGEKGKPRAHTKAPSVSAGG